jgi:hypothetical protein
MQFTNPELITARTQVLDYFVQQRLTIRDDHILFRWEKEMETDTAACMLLDQVCLEIGFPREGPNFPTKEYVSHYLTGELPQVIDFYPELEVYRDIVFIYKFMMTPSAENLPDIKYWLPSDARLQWRFSPSDNPDKKRGKFSVSGFGNKVLKPYALMPEGHKRGKKEAVEELEEEEKARVAAGGAEAEDESKELKEAREALEVAKEKEKESKPGFLASLFQRIFGTKSRAPPSAADPSALCGQEINNEGQRSSMQVCTHHLVF